MSNILLQKLVFINVSIEKVWNALTDATQIKAYFFGVDAISNWEEGSTITYQGEWQGKTIKGKGTIIQLEPNKILKHTYWSSFSGLADIPGNYHIITYELVSMNNGTQLSLQEENLNSEEMKKQSSGIWDMVLQNLKQFLEGN